MAIQSLLIIVGVLAVLSVYFWDKVHVDDPVGAVSVHLVNGVWGTIACGLFAAEKTLGIGEASTGLFYGGGFHSTLIQLVGAVSVGAWAFGVGMLIFFVLKKCKILRVDAKTELKGLDVTEHGQDAYASFQFFSNM